MKKYILIVNIALIGLIIGCSQETLTTKQAEIHESAHKALASLVETIESNKRPSNFQKVTKQSFSNDLFNMGGYGQYSPNASMYGEMNDCAYSTSNIAETAQNYNLVISTLAQCLSAMLMDDNPIYRSFYQNSNPMGQGLALELTNWRNNPLSQNPYENPYWLQSIYGAGY